MARLLLATSLVLLSAAAVAQDLPAVDEIGQQAAALEAELGKYKDASPEAAEAMVKLIELYHRDGRMFGLVRTGQKFAAAHPADPRHPAMMLKLLDGLEGVSRNKDLAATCRQFLARYPKANECAAVEVRLADALAQLDDRLRTAEACRSVWQRQPTTETGRRYGVLAVQTYSAIGNAEAISHAATLAEEMLDKLPAGEFSRQVGWQAFSDWRRISQWAKSAAVGNKLLQKRLGGDGEAQRALHMTIAENHGNLGQHANAAASYRQARKLRDDQHAHYQLIARLHHAAAKPPELESVVNEYVQKYPARQDRFQALSYLAHSYIAAGDKAKAVSILAGILADDPLTNSNAAVFVRENGVEPAKLADSEQKLLQAIAQKKDGVHYLRYVLALDLYRDRLKDNAKAKAVLREMLSQSPTDDGHTNNAVAWLLNNSADDAEFQRDVALVVASFKQNPHLANFREMLRNWASGARQNKALKDRAALALEEVKKANADPLIASWIELGSSRNDKGAAVRSRMLAPTSFGKLNSAAARSLLQSSADFYRHYASSKQRVESVGVYAQWCQRFPEEYPPAVAWLETATDYGKPEDCKAAALNLLKHQPPAASGDTWRRLLVAADKNADAALAAQAHTWIAACTAQNGPDPNAASTIGDLLLKYKLENEAVAYWTKYVAHNRQHGESRECATRLLSRLKTPAERAAFITECLKADTDFHGRYAMWLADDYLKAGDWANFEKILKAARTRQNERPLRGWEMDIWVVNGWLDSTRASKELKDDVKQRVFTAIRDLQLYPPSAGAALALLESSPPAAEQKMTRLLELQRLTRTVGNEWYDWDRILPFAQSAVARKDFVTAATLTTGMLANIPNVDENRKKAVRDLATQSFARLGSVGLTIDDNSPLAPLMQAALYYRLGDERLAFDAYLANKALFDQNRNQLPPDLLLFVCERLAAAGGDENHEQVEEIIRGWLVQFSESANVEDSAKARMQLALARNFFKAQRYEIARSEYTTVVNRYAATPQAIEAEFGVGETFMAQKVYDQAEQVFEKLARSTEIDVVVRAEFLRGVLAFRRGDRDEARDIFKAVLERVPSVELANQALFNLAEVYGAEERYIDQLNLLRTVGRLGRASKRRHIPGLALSIVVHDSDLGISRGHNRIPVRVTTEPGGDSELVYLTGSGAGKGLFRVDVETRLGEVVAGDRVLQITGNDLIKCDYPEEFKAEFRTVPLSDVEIRVAADGRFEMASSKIEDVQQESFSSELAREAEEEITDQRRSQIRPATQIKPGNPIYLRVKDGDRDLTGQTDEIVVKLTADSGDQVQVSLAETGAHTGVFEGSVATGELPAGALASDTAIDHSPLMAIDRDAASFWLSEPDGATPKTLTVDMKDLREASRVRLSTPDASKHAPVRGDLYGSQDGEFWVRIASHPERPAPAALAAEYGVMTRRVYNGNFGNYTVWQQVVDHSKNAKPIEEAPVEQLLWQRPPEGEDAAKSYAVLWQGKFIQPAAGAVRFAVQGQKTALVVDGREELPVGPGNRTVDVWLNAGPHDLAIFASAANGSQAVQALLARADLHARQITPVAFRAADFDLTSPAAKVESKPAAEAPAIPLLPATAKLTKKTEQFAVKAEASGDYLTAWQALEDLADWKFTAPAAGAYEVWIDYAHQGAGGAYSIELGPQRLAGKVQDSGGWQKFRSEKVGLLLLDSSGEHELSLKPVEIQNGGLLNLRSLTLKPTLGASAIVAGSDWEFRFPAMKLRYARFVCHEYLGEALAVNNVEIGGLRSDELHIPTKEDVLGLAANATLEIAAGDNVTGTYTDDVTLSESGASQLLTARLQATYNNAEVAAIAYDFEKSPSGAVVTVRKELKRVDPGERIVLEIVDYDEDRTSERDSVKFQVAINGGQPIEMTAVETEEYSGRFTKEVDTSPTPAKDKLVVRAGDRVQLRYTDSHNTFPGHAVPREAVVYVAEPTLAKVRILETRVIPPPPGSTARPQITVLPPDDGKEISGIAFETPLLVEVIDPDAAKDSRSRALVALTTTDGATVEVECEISPQFSAATSPTEVNWALEEGRFIGQVILQLGGKSSPAVVPLTTAMPRGLIGKVKLGDDAGEDNSGANLVTRVLNLTGKDIARAEYVDARRPDGKPQKLAAQGRLISNGVLACTDRDYDKPVTQLHVGERLYLQVTDADLDASDARDAAAIEVITELGEKETIRLEETLAHSGIFTGSLQLKAADMPTPGNLDSSDPAIETYFGDNLTIRYLDKSASTESGELELSLQLPVVVGTDGLVAAFSKTFNDETLAVETKFRIAESYFELFKSHKTLERDEEKKIDLEAGRRILREVIEDYPDPKYAPRIAYLLGQFAQELGQWDEAIRSYELILRQFPEHTLAADAQYKLAQSYEEAGDFDQALEAYVTLAATHPKSPLIPSVMIRISDYFYKHERFEVAAQVGEKFLERFEGHQHAPRMAFRVGQCYYKSKKYKVAGDSFDKFAKLFPDDGLCADALFWAGESFRMGGNASQAFRKYNRCRWDYPASEAAKYARGRLALPEMLRQFEAEANSVDDQ